MDERVFRKTGGSLGSLMRVLAEVIADAGFDRVAELLPWSREWRDAPSSRETTETFPEDIAERCVQAFSLAFQLADQAEENALVQGLRSFEDEGRMTEESGSWEQNFALLKSQGLNGEQVARALRRLHLEPVLTAHPTEAKRQTVLDHQRSLYRTLVLLENSMWTRAERARLENELRTTIERLWYTGEINLEKPSLEEERRIVHHYLSQVFPHVLPRLEARLRSAWMQAGFDPTLISDPDAQPLVTFGNWVGGDRDGHPFVTADFTADTLRLFRESALALVDEALQDLAVRLSLSATRVTTPPALSERLATWSEALGAKGEAALARNPREPWRQYINLLRAGLPWDDEADQPSLLPSAEALSQALRDLQAWLRKAGVHRLAEADVNPVLTKLRAFGFHLAAVDVRQNSAFHDKAMAQLLTLGGLPEGESYSSWDIDRRRSLLDAELATRRPFARPGDVNGTEAKAVLEVYQRLSEHIDSKGTAGLGALIVSMTRSAEDLLAVYVLAREGGLMRYGEDGAYVPLPVVPLLETIEDLQRAPEILDAYLSHPVVERSLAKQADLANLEQPIQQVMVGYSDSGKDGGIVASMWSLNRSQKALVEVGRRHGVLIRYFHGRGGTIGRGAGPTHRFVRALPPGSLQGSLRVTEQGETIRQKYANPMTGAHHLELLSASALGSRGLDETGRCDPPELVALMDQLSETSRSAYVALLSADGFVSFFERCTPIDAIENSRIGSRPSRRPGERKLSNLRAIPWVFAWNQARFVLPGWYGLGSALISLRDQHSDGFERLRRAKREESRWAPVHYLLSNAATAWATASLPLMEQYAQLADEVPQKAALFSTIVDEYERTREGLEAIYGGPLAEARPNIHRILLRRAEALEPLHRYQIELLRTWRRSDGEDAELLVRRLLRTINAISSGLGVTG